jgi:prepilin-type N-terminal cleavage/methylation domain-containing protein
MNSGCPRPDPLRPPGFTILEVMVAAALLVLGIAGAITASQQGLRALDTARNLAAASQVMQAEMERLRLMSWSQLQTLQETGESNVAVEGGRYSCTRKITDLKIDMKELTLIASWKGIDGRQHTARLITRYGRTGLNDYFYTAH